MEIIAPDSGGHRRLLDDRHRHRTAAGGRLERRRASRTTLLLHGGDGLPLSGVRLLRDDRGAVALHGCRLHRHLQSRPSPGQFL